MAAAASIAAFASIAALARCIWVADSMGVTAAHNALYDCIVQLAPAAAFLAVPLPLPAGCVSFRGMYMY